MTDPDARYRALLLEPLRRCADYTPKFGQSGVGLDLDAFTALYSADPLYSWVGLDSPLMYAAHKAAGGMTSVYRQLGIGCERLFREVLIDSFDLTTEQAKWDYSVQIPDGGTRTLYLDGRIDLEHLTRPDDVSRVSDWLAEQARRLDVQTEVKGAVFEVRQGYKSKDSKRQNADLANAAYAYTQKYLPVLTIMSVQLDADIRSRYVAGKWAVLVGRVNSTDHYLSTYAFMKQICGYDLEAFFQRNAAALRTQMTTILAALLEPE